MAIRTQEDNFDFQMKRIVKTMKRRFEDLTTLDGEQLADKIWSEYIEDFGKMCFEACCEYDEESIFPENKY